MFDVDLATRTFWRFVGREIDPDGAERWLRAPVGSRAGGSDWLTNAAEHFRGNVLESTPDAGLMSDFAALAGPDFDPMVVHPKIRDFYVHTAAWRMEVWSSWSPLFWPAGEAISRSFGKRVQQLALPMRPLDVSRGMDGRVTVITDDAGAQVAAGWVRTLRRTGDIVFSGCYALRTLPGADRPSVHVTFPLEDGNVQVFLQPHNRPNGGLTLVSPPGPWGADGAYVTVRHGERWFARRVPIHESFELYVDGDGVLRTDHALQLWNATAVRLHYRLECVGT